MIYKPYLEAMRLVNKIVPDIKSVLFLSNEFTGIGSEDALVSTLETTPGNFFTVARPFIGVPDCPEYERFIRHDPLFKELCRIVAFLKSPHTSFNPNDEMAPIAIDLLSTLAGLAQSVGEGFNLLLPSMVGIDVRQGSATNIIKLGKGTGRIKVALLQPQSFDSLPKIASASGLYTEFTLMLKSPVSPRENPNKCNYFMFY